MSSDGMFTTQSPSRRMFSVVLEVGPTPMTQRQPSQKIEESGAMLSVPSALRVETRMTGVPK